MSASAAGLRPVIMAVDDDPQVLAAIERDLRVRYGRDYRVLRAGSGDEGLEAARQLKQRGAPVALFIVDQRMPTMSGIEFLAATSALHPDARKVLLTAYADTEVAIAGINEIGLDHYLMKPWHPPEQQLYPVLDELLADWSAHARPLFDGIRVAGSQWSQNSFLIRDFLSRNHIPYQWLDVETDPTARDLAMPLSAELARLPVVLFPDGSHLVSPTAVELADRVGLKTQAGERFYDLVVVGAGPAGLANAVYGASEGLRTLLVEQKAPGGQAGSSSRIENYLGFPSGVSGAELARRAVAQARRFGTEILSASEVIGMRREDPYRIVCFADGREVSCYAVLLATGMSVRTLDVPGAEALSGAGLYYGASLSEAAAHRGKHVCILGGANSAGQSALYFARYAARVSILVRAEGLMPRMSHYLAARITETPNISVRTGVEVCEVGGDGHLQRVMLRNVTSGEIEAVETSALFVFIGAEPHSNMAAGFVVCDEKGFIMTGLEVGRNGRRPAGWTVDRDPLLFETSVPGVFAAGDVRSGANRRVAAAVGEGSAAIYSVQRYLRTV